MKKLFTVLSFLSAISTYLFSAPLSGSYTIGSGGNYSTLNTAVTDLTTNGVSGPVVFNILTGTYTEHITIPAITGVSATNTITFQSQSLNAANVIIQYDASGSVNNWICKLNSASYINFEHLTFTSLDLSYALIFNITSSTNISVNDCILNGSSFVSADPIGYKDLIKLIGGGISNLIFMGNHFNEGKNAFYCYGADPIPTTILMENNSFSNQDAYAINLLGINHLQIINNDINSCGGINLSTIGYLNISNNKIVNTSVSFYGLYILGTNGTAEMNNRIYNNFITAYGNAGFYIADEKYLNCYYNTIRKVGPNNATSAAIKIMYTDFGGGWPGMYNVLKNNIIINESTGYALYLEDRADIAISDYNNLYTNGSILINCYDCFATYATLADYQNAQGLDYNSVSCSVNFISLTDLHLAGASIGDIRLEGFPIPGITVDYDGNARNASFPYKGADESTALFTNPLAGTYTIGSGGNYSNIYAAVTALATRKISGAVIFNILPGTYTEQLTIPENIGTSPSNTVTFQSQNLNSASVIIQYNSSNADYNWVINDAASYISFRYLTMAALSTSYARILTFRNTPSHITASHCVFNGLNSGSGLPSDIIFANYVSNLEISDNTLNYGNKGIYLNSSSTNNISHNTFNEQHDYSIYLYSQQNSSITNNNISLSGGGISLQNNSVQTTIAGNNIILYSTSSRGIEVSFASGTLTSPNLIYNNMITCGRDAIYIYQSPYTYIYFNTIKTFGVINTDDQVLRGDGNNSKIINNIVINLRNGYTYLVETPPAGYISDHNNYYTTGTTPFSWNSSDYSTLSALNSVSGTDGNSVSCNVTFSSESDLHLAGASLNDLLLAGIPIEGITTDIDGDPRDPDNPFMGADEPLSDIKTNLKVFLQGPYSPGSMSTSLNSSGLIPLSQPYNIAPWSYAGIETVGSIPAGVVDWVLVELRTGTASGTKVATRAGFVKSDGTIVDLDGINQLSFPGVSSGNYYVVIRHRNHLAIMSASLVPLITSSSLYNFTTAQTQAYGTNPMKDLGAGVFGMYAGDSNGSGVIDVLDRGNTWNDRNQSTIYRGCDTDLSGVINVLDRGTTWNNRNITSQVP